MTIDDHALDALESNLATGIADPSLRIRSGGADRASVDAGEWIC